MNTININKINDSEIAQLFKDYVEHTKNMERHIKSAVDEVEDFNKLCCKEFPNNIRLQNVIYGGMMSTAVEFEESGFIAGFKTAVSILSCQEKLLLSWTQNTTPKSETRPYEAVKGENTALNQGPDKYILTTDIAKMFRTYNYLVVQKIENNILPRCNEEEKKGFFKCFRENKKHLKINVYKLDYKACNKYINYIMDKGNHSKLTEGIERFNEAIEKTFLNERGKQLSFEEINYTPEGNKKLTEASVASQGINWSNPTDNIDYSKFPIGSKLDNVKKTKSRRANFVNDGKSITSKIIANMFCTQNSEVVQRIEKSILPYCDENIKKHFVKINGFNIKNQKSTFYRLDKVACEIYLNEIEPKKSSYVRVAEGCKQMREVVDTLIYDDKEFLPA